MKIDIVESERKWENITITLETDREYSALIVSLADFCTKRPQDTRMLTALKMYQSLSAEMATFNRGE